MKIYANEFEGETRLSMQAESEAEIHHLEFIKSQLDASGADYSKWMTMESEEGICIRIINKP